MLEASGDNLVDFKIAPDDRAVQFFNEKHCNRLDLNLNVHLIGGANERNLLKPSEIELEQLTDKNHEGGDTSRKLVN